MYISKTTIQWTLFIGVIFYTININSFAVEKCQTNNILIMDQQTFFPSIKYSKVSLSNSINISLAGKEIQFNQLPKKVRRQLFNIKNSVIAHLELKDASPQDMAMVIISKPISIHNVRLGIISPPNKQTTPNWLNDLEFDNNKNKKIQCVATNISLLNLSLVFADTFNCEFGITTNGEIIFRNKTSAARSKYPFYLIKSAGKSSTVITNEIIQKDKQQKNLIIFAICFVFFMIATLAISFFKRRKNNRV